MSGPGNNPALAGLLRGAVEQSAADPAYFCRFFLSKWFPTAIPAFHLGIMALITRKVSFLDDYPDAHEFLLTHFCYSANPSDPGSAELPVFQRISAGLSMVAGLNNNEVVPRGFAKTTVYNAMTLYEALTDGTLFSIYVSASQTHAETQLGNIRFELENNEKLRAAYGDVVPSRADSEKWTSDQLQLRNGAVAMARGRGSQVRGLNYRGRRPNKILLDDVEDEESVSTDQQREKTRSWFYGSVAPAGNEMEGAGDDGQPPLQITNLGTLLGPDALCMRLAADPTFNTVKFGAMVTPDTPLWSHKMSAVGYARKRSNYAAVGRLAEFTREYDSSIRVEEDALFKASNVQLYSPVARSSLVQVAVMLDPAISDARNADDAAIIVAGRHESGMLWVLDEWGGKGKTPRELVNAMFERVRFWNPTKVGIEAIAYQQALLHLMREEMAKQQRFFDVTKVVHGKTHKNTRIKGILQPRYSNAYVRHAKPLPKLETQLQDFPNGKVDYADACAMCFELLGETAMLAAPEGWDAEAPEYAPIDAVVRPMYAPTGGYVMAVGPHDRRGRYG